MYPSDTWRGPCPQNFLDLVGNTNTLWLIVLAITVMRHELPATGSPDERDITEVQRATNPN
jgi:hypothetical protein